jgi:peptidoglycan/LPS O-acetylase OafA/YrhL
MVMLAAGLTAAALLTRGAAAGSPLFWLGFNAVFVVAILLGVVLHQAYRGRWGVADAGAVFAFVLAAYVIALRHGPTSAVSGIYTNSSAVAIAVFGALFLARDRLPYPRLVDGLSTISYPLYLLHGVNGYVVIRAVHVATGNYYLGLAAALAVTIAAATAIHLLVETPTNNFGRRVARRMRAEPAAPAEAPCVAVAGELRP